MKLIDFAVQEAHYHYNHNLPKAEVLLQEHATGIPWKDISLKYGVPESTLWSRIKFYNDTISGKRKPLEVEVKSGAANGMYREDLDTQKFMDDYESGMTTREIAKKYNTGKTTVLKRLKLAGIQMRVQQPATPKLPKPKKEKQVKIAHPTGTILTNRYSSIYWKIIERAKVRETSTEYSELHHAHPKALGGGNELSNLVRLTAKEHYICHHLLTKCTTGDDKRKMLHAWLLMAYCDKDGQRYIPAIRYQFLRQELAMVGKSEEHKAKMSDSALKRKPRKFSEEARKRMSEARKKNWSEGKYTNDHFRQIRSEQHKENISKALMGNNNRLGGFSTHNSQTDEMA